MTDDVALDTEATDISTDDATNAAEEKMLPVSRVEELVKKAKLKGRDSMQSELDALKAENEQLKASGQMGGMAAAPAIDHNAIANQVLQAVQEKFAKESQERARQDDIAEGQRIGAAYKSKMEAGRANIEDFDAVMGDFDPGAFPNLIYLATQLDNTPEVMVELMKNPAKLSSVVLMSERSPQAAQKMLANMSASIKANQQAKIAAGNDKTPAPINRLSSSTTGQDTGEKTVRDYKSIYRG